MPRTVDIVLASPLKGHQGPINRVIVREPTFSEYLEHGDPFIWVPVAESKRAYPVESAEVIAEYIKICVVDPKDPLLLEQGGFRLAQQIKEAILGFFLPGAAADAG